jgi:hypothetical protein
MARVQKQIQSNFIGTLSMPRLKRSSTGLAQAIQRLAGMGSLDQSRPFGDGLSLSEYNDRIQALQAQLATYNETLSVLDEMAENIAILEQDLRTYSEKMLMSVATRYGKDSLQYMQAGGTMRKRKNRRAKNAENSTPTDFQPIMFAPSEEKITTNGNGKKVAL